MYKVPVTNRHGETLGLQYWRNFVFSLSGNTSRFGCKSSWIVDRLKEYNCVYDFTSSDGNWLIFDTEDDYTLFKLTWG